MASRSTRRRSPARVHRIGACTRCAGASRHRMGGGGGARHIAQRRQPPARHARGDSRFRSRHMGRHRRGSDGAWQELCRRGPQIVDAARQRTAGSRGTRYRRGAACLEYRGFFLHVAVQAHRPVPCRASKHPASNRRRFGARRGSRSGHRPVHRLRRRPLAQNTGCSIYTTWNSRRCAARRC